MWVKLCVYVQLSVRLYVCVCVTEGYKVHQYTARAHSARARTLRIVVKCIHLINLNRGERENSITTERRINIRMESAEVKAQQTSNTKVGKGTGIDWVGVYIHLIYEGTLVRLHCKSTKDSVGLRYIRYIKQYNICTWRLIYTYYIIYVCIACWFVCTQRSLLETTSSVCESRNKVTKRPI